MLVQGFNNQWNEAALKMKELMDEKNGIGKMIGGQCICWGRQNLTANPPQIMVVLICFLGIGEQTVIIYSGGEPKQPKLASSKQKIHKNKLKDL